MLIHPACALVFALSAVAASNTVAQTYPTKPIRLVVPFAAGGALDVVGRVIGVKPE